MKKRHEYLLMLAISAIMFFLDSILMGKLGIYVDAYGTSPSTVWGSHFWNYMDWIVWLLLGLNFVYWFLKTVLYKKS